MAVYTELSFGEAVQFLRRFDVGELKSCDGIAQGVENSNFLIKTSRGSFILTIYEKRVRQSDLPWFLGLMHCLYEQGLTVPNPVADEEGATIHKIRGKAAALTTFLPGKSPDVIEEWHCHALGEALAQFHIKARSFKYERTNTMGLACWDSLLKQCDKPWGQENPQRYQFLLDSLEHLRGCWPDPKGDLDLPRGQIHADLFPDNVFFRNRDVSGIIDFYFACTDYLAYDIAICLSSWCFTPENGYKQGHARALLSGYQKHRRLTEQEKKYLPLFLQGAAMRFLVTRLYDWIHTPKDALVERKDPEEYILRLHVFRDFESGSDVG